MPGGLFVGGPLDGSDVSAALAVGRHHGRFYVDPASHAAYMRTDCWQHVGVECGGCSAIIAAGDDGRAPVDCPLCGADLQPVRGAEAQEPGPSPL